MYLKEINTNNNSAYDKLVENATIFSNAQWISMYGKSVTVIGIFNNNNDLIGTYFTKKRNYFRVNIFQTPSFSPHCGLYFINPSSNNANIISFEKEVMSLIKNYFKAQKSILTLVAFPFQYSDLQEFFWNKYKIIPNYTYQLNLNLSQDELFLNYSTDRRKSIKKAIKDEITCHKTQDYEIVKQLILKTFNRKSKKINLQFLDKILFEFANENNSFAYVSIKDNKPIATTFCIYNKQACYYLLGGYDSNHKHHGAGPLCMHNSILEAKQKNIALFDFEGSMLPEVEKYFREFGGELKPYFVISKALLPLEFILKIIKRQQF